MKKDYKSCNDDGGDESSFDGMYDDRKYPQFKVQLIDFPPKNNDGRTYNLCAMTGCSSYPSAKENEEGKLSSNDDCSSDSNDRTVPMSPVPSTPTKNILPELSSDEYDSLPDSGNPAAHDNRQYSNILPELSSDEYDSLPDSGNPVAHDNLQYNGHHNDTTDSDSDSDNKVHNPKLDSNNNNKKKRKLKL